MTRPHLRDSLLLATACVLIARSSATQTAATPFKDPLFSGVDRFEKNATSVTRVEDAGHHHDENTGARDEAGEPRRISTVYVYKYDSPGLYNTADVESFRQRVRTADWSCKTCPGNGVVSAAGKLALACERPVGASSEESAVIVQKPRELTFVHTIGHRSSGSKNIMQCSEDD